MGIDENDIYVTLLLLLAHYFSFYRGKYTKLGRGRPKSIKQRWFVYEKLEGRLQMMILMVTACEKN